MREMNRLAISIFLFSFWSLHQLTACLWDVDTIAAELARFPGLAEIMTGQFPRHSREFYEWRRKMTQAALAADAQQVELYDDLAVAQHKLGDHLAAISTMMKKEKIKPGLYETYSNLGTFYIYTGQMESALLWINKALAINANAHFGREKYQKWLVEWIREREAMSDADRAEAQKSRGYGSDNAIGFAHFLGRKHLSPQVEHDFKADIKLTPLQKMEAINGVMGMMRFADFDNPLLLEALGDLLLTGSMHENSAQLAALAYLQASRKVTNAEEEERLLNRLGDATRHSQVGRTTLTQMLDNGLAKGRIFAEAVRTDEIAWITNGKVDPNEEFQKKYLLK